MKRFITSLFLLTFILVACKTRTNPKKVERNLPGEFWKITSFIENGTDISSNYTDYLFGFNESGGASIKIDGQIDFINGSYSLGTQKNPAILYLSFPLTNPIDNNIMLITDDWIVNSVTDKEIKLSRNGSGQSASNVTLSR